MKCSAAAVLLCAAAWAGEPTIRTVAGSGSRAFVPITEGGAAVEMSLPMPAVVAVDGGGNLYIGMLWGPVYKVTPDGAIRTAIAYPGALRPGCGQWSGIAIDGEARIYLSDFTCHEVARYDADGARTVLAGTAELKQPSGIALDSAGNLYVADYGNLRVRVVRRDGSIATVAGSGRDEWTRGDRGPATAASIRPAAIAVDPAGNLYVADHPSLIADPYFVNHSIRKITADGIISTLAGSLPDRPDVVMPMAVAAPSEDLVYFTDFWRVRAIGPDGVKTVAGSAVHFGYGGTEGGPAADAIFYGPTGLAVDGTGGLIVSDVVNGRVRKIEFAH